MSERVTNAMLHNAGEYLAELLGVQYEPHARLEHMKPGDIGLDPHPMRNGRYFFAIARYEDRFDSTLTERYGRKMGLYYPMGPHHSISKREAHDMMRFAANLIHDHAGIIARAKEMKEL